MEQRAREVSAFTRKYYEQGRHDRSLRWVWRYRVEPAYHISYSTLKKYLKITEKI
jgi:hypothetical protein